MLVAAGLSIICFFGGLGAALQPFSPLVAIVLALVLPPVLALATKGRWYLRRTDDGIDAADGRRLRQPVGRRCSTATSAASATSGPDMCACEAHDAFVCSLCLSTDKVGEHVLPAQETREQAKVPAS